MAFSNVFLKFAPKSFLSARDKVSACVENGKIDVKY